MDKLLNKTAIVSGAASGIGKGIACAFAEEGANLVIADTNAELAAQVVSYIESIGSKAVFIQTDISKEEQVENLMKTAAEHFGGIDILVNNAGVFNIETEKIHEMQTSKWRMMVDINLNGTWMMCKYAIPYLLQSEDPVIINISSPAGLEFSIRAAYGATKGAIIQLTKSIAIQYPGKIRANCICPGSIDTPGRNAARKNNVHAKGSVAQLTQRDGKPSDIGKAAVFLASGDGSFVNAAILRVDGGLCGQRPKAEDLAPWKDIE